MSPLTLLLRNAPPSCLDMSGLTPERLAGLTASKLKALPIPAGRRRLPLSDIFEVRGGDTQHLVIAGNNGRFRHVGDAMTSGTLEVRGNGGHYLGRHMQGGQIIVQGDCGDWTGCAMTGGSIRIQGSIGSYAGASLPGDTGGMANGTIVVHGNAGDRTGDRMRSGMILVLGDCGDYAGSGMKAGTILVLGRTGKHTGTGMHRGSIVLARRPQHLPLTFTSCGKLKMEFLRLLFKELASLQPAFRFFHGFGPEAERYAGDHASAGKGEILVLLNAAQGAIR